MKKSKLKLNKKFQRWLKRPVAVAIMCLIGVSALTSVVMAGYTTTYKNKIYPNTYIGVHDLGGKTPEEAESVIKEAIAALPPDITIAIDDQDKEKVARADLGATYNTSETAQQLYAVGRSGTFGHSLKEITLSLVGRNNRVLAYTLPEEKAEATFKAVSTKLGTKSENARIILNNDGSLTISPAKEGDGVTDHELKDGIKSSIATLTSRVTLTTHPIKPHITESQLTATLDTVKAMIAKAPITLVAEDKSAVADIKIVFSWITYKKDTAKPSVTPAAFVPGRAHAEESVIAEINNEAVKSFITAFATSVNREASNASLGVTNGVIQVIKPHTNGQSVKIDEAVTLVINHVTNPDTTANTTLTMPLEVVQAKVQESTISSLGIKELIGHGETNFKGSPANRIHNITTGARFLNGALIAPGETFSTVKKLGAVDGSTGYLPELVIKEDKTTPEFGGGLCQVSTTLFRSVLNAGLRIVERQNHSYRVSYYEPPVGLDATIYLPKPDFRFLNDTPGYILMQTKVAGTKITFDLYGTKDGRSSVISEPIITDITEPPPPAYISTDTLPTGVTKQIEKPHQGAKTVVTYVVTRDGKELFKQTFRSNYKAWQSKFLVGTAPVPAPPPAPEPTPTPAP